MRLRMNGMNSCLLALLFACLFFGGKQLLRARRYAHATPIERSTTARHLYRQHHLMRGLKFNYFTCVFFFDVHGYLYRGDGDCPQLTFAGAAREVGTGLAGESTGDGAIVYYDAADPMIHSTMDFNAACRDCIHNALPWIVLGACSLLCLIFFAIRKPREMSAAERTLS
jgi:hypothetical protein